MMERDWYFESQTKSEIPKTSAIPLKAVFCTLLSFCNPSYGFGGIFFRLRYFLLHKGSSRSLAQKYIELNEHTFCGKESAKFTPEYRTDSAASLIY